MRKTLVFLTLFIFLALSSTNAQWISLGGQGKDVAVQGNNPWTLGTDNGIYSHSIAGWKQYPGAGQGLAIAVGPNRIPWVIGMDNAIYQGTGAGWTQLPGGGRGKDIAVAGNGRPWVIGMDDGIYYFENNRWIQYPGLGRGKAISVSLQGVPFVIGMDDGIYQGTGSGWAQLPGAGKGKDIAVDSSGIPWVIGTDQRIYRHDGSRWNELPGGGQGYRIAIDQPGVPLVLGMDRAIWQYGGGPVPPPPAAVNLTGRWACNDGGRYFLRQLSNELWWYGQSGDGGATWSNVFHGQVKGDQVHGRWSDVPLGQIMNSGEMTLQIISNNNLRSKQKTGGFGGSEWTR